MKLFRRNSSPAATGTAPAAETSDIGAPAPRRSRFGRVLRIALLATALPAATGAFAMAAFPTSTPVARTVVWMFGAQYLGRDGVVMQKGTSDCGIAALQMVLAGRGIPASSLDSARAAVLERGGDGASMEELKELAGARGVRAVGWHLGLRGLSRAPLPAIVHLGDHFAVADRVLADGRVEMRDPSLGRMRISAEDFRDIWTGNVLLFPRRRPGAAPAKAHGAPAPAAAQVAR